MTAIERLIVGALIVISLANITASIAQTRQADCTAAAASLTSGD